MRNWVVLDPEDLVFSKTQVCLMPKDLAKANEYLLEKLLEASGFTCIHEREGEGYCDGCPASSLADIDRAQWACLRGRRYSK